MTGCESDKCGGEAAVEEALLRVVRGDPSEDELAALVTVVRARAEAARRPAPDERPHDWAAYWRLVRQPLRPGPDAWRSSARPR